MGENVERHLELVARMALDQERLSVERNVKWLHALLKSVDAEATERAARVCADKMRQRSKESDDEKRNGTDRNMRALLNQALGAAICEEAIRSTLPTPAAQEAQKP